MSVGNVTQGVDSDRRDLSFVPGENLDLGYDGCRNDADQINNIESDRYNNRLLLQIYQNL